MNRRLAGKAVGAALVAPQFGTTAARAQVPSDRPMVIVVPYAPGGTTDLLGRLVAQGLATALARTVLVENRPGAGSTIGAAHVARAAPDGNTLLLATSSTLAINPSLYPKLPYDPQRDFAPIGMIASAAFVLVVPAASEVHSVAALLDVARRKPGGLSYGSAGNGSPQHLAAELFKAATGVELRHVPYGGSAAALVDVLSGQLDLMFADLAPALSHVRADRLRALGVTSLRRQSTLPETAPIAEGSARLSRFEAVAWQSLVAPANTPSALIDRIGLALRHLLDQPSTRDRLQREGVEPRTSTADELAAAIRSDTEGWAKLIKAARISIG